jgi:hypothetical protein
MTRPVEPHPLAAGPRCGHNGRVMPVAVPRPIPAAKPADGTVSFSAMGDGGLPFGVAPHLPAPRNGFQAGPACCFPPVPPFLRPRPPMTATRWSAGMAAQGARPARIGPARAVPCCPSLSWSLHSWPPASASRAGAALRWRQGRRRNSPDPFFFLGVLPDGADAGSAPSTVGSTTSRGSRGHLHASRALPLNPVARTLNGKSKEGPWGIPSPAFLPPAVNANPSQRRVRSSTMIQPAQPFGSNPSRPRRAAA